ncbi:DUF4113 domain-containing protein [Pseudomonas syringae]
MTNGPLGGPAWKMNRETLSSSHITSWRELHRAA